MNEADAKTVKVGDGVGFKCDVEQGSKVLEIRRGRFTNRIEFKVEVHAGEFKGETIWVAAEDCF